MFKMMKNSAPNRFIWAHIFKKAPTSEGGTSPSDTPLRRASGTAGADAPFFTSKILPPPHFENRSAAYGYRDVRLWRPPCLRLSLSLQVSHFKQKGWKVTSQYPLLRKKKVDSATPGIRPPGLRLPWHDRHRGRRGHLYSKVDIMLEYGPWKLGYWADS